MSYLSRVTVGVVLLAAIFAARATAAVQSVHGPAWRPPMLQVTSPASGEVDLAWQNVPGANVVVFSFSPGGVCIFGCETFHPNTGSLDLVNPNTSGATQGFSVCSTDVEPQVCTQKEWVTVQ